MLVYRTVAYWEPFVTNSDYSQLQKTKEHQVPGNSLSVGWFLRDDLSKVLCDLKLRFLQKVNVNHVGK